mgnify:CR=1 FL=1
MKTILVTGGAGFIGSHTCLSLLRQGYCVYVIDSFLNSSPKVLERIIEINKLENPQNVPKLNLFKGDLRNKEFLEKVFHDFYRNDKKFDGIIHFAGLKSVAESFEKPLSYWEVNVLGTINLLEIMKRYNCDSLVFSSSATIYAQKEKSFLSEDSELDPINPYGRSKLAAEIVLRDVFEASNINLKFAALRYFNPIGAHFSGLIGENPRGKPNNILPLIINTAIGEQKELEIFGNDWPTKDGTPIRDYIHVMDLADAHIKVLENLFQNKHSFINLNVGTGIGTSVLELIKIFEKVNNIKVPYVFSKRRPGDACYVVANNSKLINKFKIVPKFNIEDMCRDGWKWKKKNPNGYFI